MESWVFGAIGVVLAAIMIAAIRFLRFSLRKTLAIGLIVTGAIYPVFAIVFDASADQLLVELGGAALFSLFAWAGLARSVRWLTAGWALHALWDIGLHAMEPTRDFAPTGYPQLCLTFDLVVAASLWFYHRERLEI